MNSVALIVGMYICIHSHFYKSTCIDFLVSQLIDYAPSFYVWFCVMSYYHQLKTVTSLYTPPIIKYSVNSKEELAFRRRKVRSMTENSNIKYRIYLGDDSNLITESRIENLVQQSKIHLPKNSRSLDTLLTSTSVDSALLSIYEKNRVEVADRVLVDIPETLSKMIENETVDSIICHDFKVEKRFSTTFFKMNNLHDKFKMVDEDNKNIKITTNQNNVSDILRATESEKQTCPHSSKMHVVNKDALPEISEFEIRPVLNYSTTTMATPKEGLSLTNKVIEKKIHSFSRRLISPRLQHVHTYYVEASNQPEGFESGPPISSQNSNDFRIYTCDFTCQTSTLSRNVLKIAEKLSFSGFSSFQSNLQLLVNKFERHNIYPFKADGYTVEYYIQAEKNKSCSLLAKHV
ncbi:hypothetical protein FQR65_LT12060 [Abscondita terminalis]|nr:hypothetical protein FQR65_LT12060 [Abscondita terminalis]